LVHGNVDLVLVAVWLLCIVLLMSFNSLVGFAALHAYSPSIGCTLHLAALRKPDRVEVQACFDELSTGSKE